MINAKFDQTVKSIYYAPGNRYKKGIEVHNQKSDEAIAQIFDSHQYQSIRREGQREKAKIKANHANDRNYREPSKTQSDRPNMKATHDINAESSIERRR